MKFLKRFGRSSEVIDLTDEKEKAALWAAKNKPQLKFQGDFADLTPDKATTSQTSQSSSASGSAFSFLDMFSSNSESQKTDLSSDLTKKIQIMSRRIEDQSNEIYHLTNKIDLLERKINRLEGKDNLEI